MILDDLADEVRHFHASPWSCIVHGGASCYAVGDPRSGSFVSCYDGQPSVSLYQLVGEFL